MSYTSEVLMRLMILPLTITAVAAAAPFLMTLPEAPPLPEEVAEVVPEPSWKCPECSVEEQYVLKELQENTKITDKNALATLMGNIKQESKFIPNICEGGARVSYTECKVGGYGLIQWTSIGRYKGLGNFCARFSCDPSSLEGQTRWMINEPIFQRVLPEFEGHGDTIPQYMTHAYYWLGWGIKGNREVYAYDYESKLTWV
ncbi:hypothetical protein CPLG_00105 [Cyanophage S-SSM2]|uniref:Phage tail lysozyme domain-containing protein n=2 Tax=Ahtivirus sagseatwo TaxID=2734079 RepID=M4T3D7_9CAUD|nr:hypothetical protein CPLG_00105 [Cyanophage S-SSM2]